MKNPYMNDEDDVIQQNFGTISPDVLNAGAEMMQRLGEGFAETLSTPFKTPDPYAALVDQQPGVRMTNVDNEGVVYRVPKMTAEELAVFLPRCMVCGDEIPDRRAKARKETCAKPACQLALKQYRRAVLESRKCPTCYKPSTPAERESFRQWRYDTNQIRKGRGRPPVARERQIRERLQALVELIHERLDSGTFVQSAGDIEGALKKLIDLQGAS